MSIEAFTYAKHMNLKLAANELGMKWQTLYVSLKKQGIAVVGDKLRYGTDRDRLAAMAESEFMRLVPSAVDMNKTKFQAKFDFNVNGYKVDVKAATPRVGCNSGGGKRWAFSFKKQSLVCDFICCFCFNESKVLDRVLLVPSEFFSGLQSVSVSCSGVSKWLDYAVEQKELEAFFNGLPRLEI